MNGVTHNIASKLRQLVLRSFVQRVDLVALVRQHLHVGLDLKRTEWQIYDLHVRVVLHCSTRANLGHVSLELVEESLKLVALTSQLLQLAAFTGHLQEEYLNESSSGQLLTCTCNFV